MNTYNRRLDNVMFKHHKIPKKNGTYRDVFEFNTELSAPLMPYYISHKYDVQNVYKRLAPSEVYNRTAYNQGVSIPMLIDKLAGSKVFVQLDIVNFFNNVRLEGFDYLIPRNYYFDPVNKVGIKQGTNISGTITNLALLEFDKHMLEKNSRYCRYADDIMIGVDTMEEATAIMEHVCAYMERLGLEINRRKTMITDLSQPGERYVKYLGYTIKRDKYNTDKLRVSISRKRRNKWWAVQQNRHAQTKIKGGFTCLN